MAHTHFVLTNRQMLGRPRKRITDIVGPFETFNEACDYRRAWVALWAEQRGKATVETPISPSPAVTDWYVEHGAEKLGMRFDDDYAPDDVRSLDANASRFPANRA